MDFDADVIVVGAGPSGAMIASEIALTGARVIVLERRTGPVESRAGTLLPRVLEIFDSRGIADRFIARMSEISAYPFRPTHIFAGLKFVQWQNIGSRFGFTLGLPQNHTEELLLSWAIENGADVRDGHAFTGLRQHDDGVEAEFMRSSGDIMKLRAHYLVGADGGRSTVRHALGLNFTGHSGTFTGIVADAEITAPWSAGHFGTDNACGWLRGFGFGEGITRFNMVHRQSMKCGKDEPVTVEEIRRNLEEIAGEDFGVRSLRWTSRYDDTMRCVERLRSGRVFLVGESARIHYPASGVGMNFCLQDAFNLGWKLGMVVRGEAAESLLDSYQSERMPVIERLLDSVRAQVAVQFNFSEEGQALKRTLEDEHLPGATLNRRLGLELNGIEKPYFFKDGQHQLAGLPAPDLDLVLPDGTVTRIGELLRRQQFLLLDLTGQMEVDTPGEWADRIRFVKAITSRRGENTASVQAMLIRPDAYVAWASDQPVRPNAWDWQDVCCGMI